MNCVLITGATSGIGLQLARDYAQSGWEVIACGRNAEVLTNLADEYSAITGLQFDVTDLNAAQAAVDQLEASPNLWIFNAGDCEYIEGGVMDAELVKRVFSINVIGLANSIEACQSQFKSGHRVAIVGSIASELALPRAEAYGASKAAVGYLARTLSLDLKSKGVDVSVVYPGFVQTPLTDKNTFNMPMMVSVEHASNAIRDGLSKGHSHIYFPKLFTTIIRCLGALPYRWQHFITKKLIAS